MGKQGKMYFIIYIVITLIVSCKKADPILINPPKVTIEPVPADTNTSKNDPAPANSVIYDLGTGSGHLTIDGNSLKISDNSIIKIKGGNYKSITIRNIQAPKNKTVYIKNDGTVKISEGMYTYNVSNIVISGDNSPSIQYGFQFENIAYRAISMHGLMTNVTLGNMSFKNVANYVIAGENTNGKDLVYTGTPTTLNENFKILNCLFDNTGSIIFGGNLSKVSAEDTGLFKDVEIAFNSFKNTEAGSVCVFTNVQDYDIHHNTVDNINRTNNNHNGVFFMQGNGKFHDNKLTNYQGNAIRMWIYSRGNTPSTNEIFNNICHNTRKYGGFEVQEFDRNLYPGKSTFAHVKVYNNTVGAMNSSKDWEGQILDLYNIHGNLEFYNNLGYNLYASNKVISTMINNMSDTKITKIQNNKYVVSQNEAVTDVNKFVSKFNGIGASL